MTKTRLRQAVSGSGTTWLYLPATHRDMCGCCEMEPSLVKRFSCLTLAGPAGPRLRHRYKVWLAAQPGGGMKPVRFHAGFMPPG